MSAELVGREEELQRVELFLEAARHSPRALLIEGEAGAGKTSIWEAALAAAARAGSSAVAARPAEAETSFAYAALGDLLRERSMLWRACRHASARHSRSPFCSMTRRLTRPTSRASRSACWPMFRRLAEDGPLVVAIDDVQWLDATSAQVLRFAMRRVDDGADRVPGGMANRAGSAGSARAGSRAVERAPGAPPSPSAEPGRRAAPDPDAARLHAAATLRSGAFTTCPAATRSSLSSWRARSAPASLQLEAG